LALVLTTIIALQFVDDANTEAYFDPPMLAVISIAYLCAWLVMIRTNWRLWSMLGAGLVCTVLADAMLYWYILAGSPLHLGIGLWLSIVRSLLFWGGPALLLGLLLEWRKERAGVVTMVQPGLSSLADDQGLHGMVAVLAAALPVTVADTSGRIVNTTAAMDAMAGYSPGELTGKNLTTLMPPKWVKHHKSGLKRYLATGESEILGKVVPVELLRKDGTVIPVSLAVTVGEYDGERWLIGGMWEREPDAP
jgi:PAS domain S-box-containing protein